MMSDLISRQKALKAMETWDKFGCDPDGKLVRYDDDKHYIPYVHYEDMVHAIKHIPSAQSVARDINVLSNDLISRQAAIDALTDKNIIEHMDSVYDSELHRFKRATERIIAQLPSAQQEQKKGKWIYEEDTIIHGHCSCCGFQAIFYETDVFNYDYCPNCGARLEEGDPSAVD